MPEHKIFLIIGLLVILAILAVFATLWAVADYDREVRLKARMQEAVAPSARPTVQMEEELKLVRTKTRMEVVKDQAASLLGVDLQQAETYPIKWPLVLPIAGLLTWGMMFLLSHPLHGYPVIWFGVKYFGTPVVWYGFIRIIFNMFTNRRNNKLIEQFPDALNTVVRCVRVGIPMGEALRTVARDAQEPTKAEFAILADKVSIGVPLDVALNELSERIKLTEYQFFATALTLQARSGGGITQTLENLADVIRKRVGLKARGYALTAEARASSMVLSLLPFVAGGMIFMVQRKYMMVLFTTSAGEAVVTGAIVMLIVGMGIIQLMISNVLK